MIVPSMSHREIYDALSADREKLQIKANSLIPKMVKLFKKEGIFPAWKWAEYTHQRSRNKFLIIYYVPSAAQVEHPKVSWVAFMEEDKQRVVVQWGCWPYRRFGSMDVIMVRAMNLFCPHFFQRYRERVWNKSKMSYNDLLCRYFSRNQSAIPVKLTEEIQRNYKKYGEYSYSFQQVDGVCFVNHGLEGDELTIGSPDDNSIFVTLYYTIVTRAMMKEIQKNAIDKGGEEYAYNHFKHLFEDAMNDVIFRLLNIQENKTIKPQIDMPQMISMEECEQIGYHTEEKIFNNIVKKLNERHQSRTGLPYFDHLSIDLAQGDEILQEAFPEAHNEIQTLMKEEYRALDELEQHCLFIYLFTNDKDEDEIVDSMSWHFEEKMEEVASSILSKRNNQPS